MSGRRVDQLWQCIPSYKPLSVGVDVAPDPAEPLGDLDPTDQGVHRSLAATDLRRMHGAVAEEEGPAGIAGEHDRNETLAGLQGLQYIRRRCRSLHELVVSRRRRLQCGVQR